jgi:uncharacterized protein
VTTHLDPANPWVFSTRELGRRAGAMRAFHRDVPAPDGDRRVGLDDVTVELGELFAYPDSVTDETTDSDELPRVVDEHVDLEQTVRDAVVLTLPLAPLCSDDCPGLCPECGERRADLGPDHGHETLDPRWAALRERMPN